MNEIIKKYIYLLAKHNSLLKELNIKKINDLHNDFFTTIAINALSFGNKNLIIETLNLLNDFPEHKENFKNEINHLIFKTNYRLPKISVFNFLVKENIIKEMSPDIHFFSNKIKNNFEYFKKIINLNYKSFDSLISYLAHLSILNLIDKPEEILNEIKNSIFYEKIELENSIQFSKDVVYNFNLLNDFKYSTNKKYESFLFVSEKVKNKIDFSIILDSDDERICDYYLSNCLKEIKEKTFYTNNISYINVKKIIKNNLKVYNAKEIFIIKNLDDKNLEKIKEIDNLGEKINKNELVFKDVMKKTILAKNTNEIFKYFINQYPEFINKKENLEFLIRMCLNNEKNENINEVLNLNGGINFLNFNNEIFSKNEIMFLLDKKLGNNHLKKENKIKI